METLLIAIECTDYGDDFKSNTAVYQVKMNHSKFEWCSSTEIIINTNAMPFFQFIPQERIDVSLIWLTFQCHLVKMMFLLNFVNDNILLNHFRWKFFTPKYIKF